MRSEKLLYGTFMSRSGVVVVACFCEMVGETEREMVEPEVGQTREVDDGGKALAMVSSSDVVAW